MDSTELIQEYYEFGRTECHVQLLPNSLLHLPLSKAAHCSAVSTLTLLQLHGVGDPVGLAAAGLAVLGGVCAQQYR